MPFVPKADGRSYNIFPAAATPGALPLNGKLYGKVSGGQVQLFYLSDTGVETQITPGGGGVYPFELPETVTPAPLADTGKLYAKDVAGVSQLFFLDDAGVEWQLTPSLSGSYFQPAIIYRPGVPSSGTAVATWAEVAAQIAATQGATIVFLDPTFGVPNVDAITNCFSATRFQPLRLAPSLGTNELVIDDGAQLIDPAIFAGNMNVHGAPTTIPGVLMTQGSPLFIREGAGFTQDVGATVSFIENTNAGFGQIVLLEGAVCINNEPTIPMALTVPLGFFVFATVLTFQQPVPTTLIGGGAGGTLFWLTDSTIVANQQTFYAGTQLNQRTSKQGAILPDTGNTASRPTYALEVGQMYFDTDLVQPIWYNGVAWVNAAGVVV